jgi:hypothetical protein
MRPARQKPNEACGCGSGKKHKKCCGGASANAPGAAAGALDNLEPTKACMAEVDRLVAEARAAEAAGEWARSKRRATRALAVAGDGIVLGSHNGAAVWLLAKTAIQCLVKVLDASRQEGRPVLSELEDVHARVCALLQPPHRFWARGLTRLSHARWRDAPVEDEQDAQLELPAAVAAEFAVKWLRSAHAALGVAYAAWERDADVIACSQRALEACALEPPSEERELAAAELHYWLGQTLCTAQPDRARASFQAALAAAERAGPSPFGVVVCARARRGLAELACAGGDNEQGVSAEELASLEDEWACPGAAAITRAWICRRALHATYTAATQRPCCCAAPRWPARPRPPRRSRC